MKLNKLTKGMFAAVALTAAGFANAGAAASSNLTVENFSILNSDFDVFADIFLVENDYFGSAASTKGSEHSIETIFTNPNEANFDQDGLGFPNFDLAASGPYANSTVTFDGLATIDGGASGTTNATASITGTGVTSATSKLENSAQFFVDNGNNIAGESFSAFLSFTYIVDLIADSTVAFEFGAAESSASFQVLLFGTQGTNFVDITNDFTNEGLANISDSEDVIESVTLKEGETYFLTVIQASGVDVQSVSEPATMAFFGLGLLGLAGAARRRKA